MPTLMDTPGGLFRAKSRTTMKTEAGKEVEVPCEPYYDYSRPQRQSTLSSAPEGTARNSSLGTVPGGPSSMGNQSSPRNSITSSSPQMRSSRKFEGNVPVRQASPAASASKQQKRLNGVKSSSALSLCCCWKPSVAQDESAQDGNPNQPIPEKPRSRNQAPSRQGSPQRQQLGSTQQLQDVQQPRTKVPAIKHAFSNSDLSSEVSSSTLLSGTTLSGTTNTTFTSSGTASSRKTHNATPASIPSTISDLDLDSMSEADASGQALSPAPVLDRNRTSFGPHKDRGISSTLSSNVTHTINSAATSSAFPGNFNSRDHNKEARQKIIPRVPGGYATNEPIVARPISSGTRVSTSHGDGDMRPGSRYSRHVRFDQADPDEAKGQIVRAEGVDDLKGQGQGSQLEQESKKKSPFMGLMKRGVSRF